MAQKKPTMKQLDAVEAIVNEFIDRDHMRSSSPGDDSNAFKEKFRRHLDNERRKITQRSEKVEDREVDFQLFEFESDEAEREFEEKVREIFPDPDIHEQKKRARKKVGSYVEGEMAYKERNYIFSRKVEVTAKTWARGCTANRLVAKIRRIGWIGDVLLDHWEEKAEPASYVSITLTRTWSWGLMRPAFLETFGTAHIMYSANWTRRDVVRLIWNGSKIIKD